MSAIVLPDSIARAVIDAIAVQFGTVAFSLADANLRLFGNDLIPNPFTPVSAFVELTAGQVPGYSSPVLSTGPPAIRNNSQQWELNYQSGSYAFLATGDPAVPIVAYGWFATGFLSALDLRCSGRFDVPFVFSKAGDGFAFAGKMTFDGISQIVLPNLDPV